MATIFYCAIWHVNVVTYVVVESHRIEKRWPERRSALCCRANILVKGENMNVIFES